MAGNYDANSLFAWLKRFHSENPDKQVGWSVYVGDNRSKRSNAKGSTLIPEDYVEDDIAEEIDNILSDLEEGPDEWAWIELRQSGQTRILQWWSYKLRRNPPMELQKVDASGVMAQQLVIMNQDLLKAWGMMTRENRELLGMYAEMYKSLAVNQREIELMEEYETAQVMLESVKSLAPALEKALVIWATAKMGSKPRPPGPDAPRVDNDDEESGIDADEYAEDLISRFEWLAENHPAAITDERAARVLQAYNLAAQARANSESEEG